MNNYVASGKSVTLTAPTGGVVAGVAYLIGSLFAVAATTVAQTLPFTGHIEGVFTLVKATGTAWTEGQALYYNLSTGEISPNAGGGDYTFVGFAAAAAVSGAATGQVKLVPSRVDRDALIEESGEITTAQLLALNGTPQELVAAPGAGLYIMVDYLELFLDYASVAYDGVATGEDLSLKYASAGAIASIETTGFLDQSSDQRRIVRGHGTAAPIGVNEAVQLALLVGEIATGDSPLKYKVGYRVVTSES